MAKRKVEFFQGGYYHVYNRGANREVIFCSDANYNFLLRRIKENLDKWQVAVIAYCLMPNHYHLALRQDSEHPLSGFIQAVFNSYTKAYNKMWQRSGTLFEGPFEAIRVEDEQYLLQLCRYIHRNPLDACLVKNLRDWKYSNYPEWVNQRSGTLVDHSFVRELFPDPKAYIDFVENYEPPEKISRDVRPMLFDS